MPMNVQSTEAAAEVSFESLLTPLLGPAFGVALHLTRNRADAEDLVQEASLLAFRGFRTFQQGTNFKAWFMRILTNAFYSRYRRRRTEPQTIDLEDASELYLYIRTAEAGLHQSEPDPARALLTRMDSEQVGEALDALPADYRVVATLYFIQDMSYQDIAASLDIPVGTVRSRLHRGRKMLQKSLWHIAVEQGVIQVPVEKGA